MVTSENKLVSIIVPVYNTKPYLRQCLDSIIKQKYKNIQVIVVDDGSTDGSGELCDEFAVLDKRVEVIHTENGGSVKARKEGLKVARGDYIGFVDSDDYIDADMFAILTNIMEETDVDFVHSGYNQLKGNIKSKEINFDNGIYDVSDEVGLLDFLKKNILDIKSGRTISYSIWSKLFKAELIKNCFGKLNDNQQLGEDAICLFRCVLESNKIALETISLYNYRVLEGSLSHLENELFLLKQISLFAEILKVLEEYGYTDQIREEIYQFLLSSLLSIVKNDKNRSFKLEQFYWNNIDMFKGKRIVIYGAGNVGEDLYERLLGEGVDITGIIDKNLEKKSKYGSKFISPDNIDFIEFDYILIAVLDEKKASIIRQWLIERKIDINKIIWMRALRYY